MDPVISIIVIAFLGPVLVFLTRYVLKGKGRTAAASRLWFVSFCTFVVYYWLAKDKYIVTPLEPFYFALLWPIVAVLTFWLTERLNMKRSPMPLFRWMVYFLAGVIFAFVMDILSNALGWYTYIAGAAGSTILNPVTGGDVPAIVLLMLGVLLTGVFYLSDNAYVVLKRRIGAITTTYVLIGLSFIWGGFAWMIFDALVNLVK